MPGVLQKVAQIGYRDLQSSYSKQAGIYGMRPRDFMSMTGPSRGHAALPRRTRFPADPMGSIAASTQYLQRIRAGA